MSNFLGQKKVVGPMGIDLKVLLGGSRGWDTTQSASVLLKQALKNGARLWYTGSLMEPCDLAILQHLEHYFTDAPNDAHKIVLWVEVGIDAEPGYIRKAVEACVKHLRGRKAIDMFSTLSTRYWNPDVCEVVDNLVREGLVKGISTSEQQHRQLQQMHVSLQSKVSCLTTALDARDSEAFAATLRACRALGLPMLVGCKLRQAERPEVLERVARGKGVEDWRSIVVSWLRQLGSAEAAVVPVLSVQAEDYWLREEAHTRVQLNAQEVGEVGRFLMHQGKDQ